ncbi:MAG: flagellar hook capping FlgD N-terminal domain-containing protein [Pygmaiobacter massiliensis]|nr:flagellar hook capping FlgD N-terminal domain-containing protein [Pygmaiobacter massiliensis]
MANTLTGLDISSVLSGANSTTINSSNKSAGSNSLDMDDFLNLIVQQFQNHDIENAASTSDMLNQLVQMTTIQAISNITDATTMMYTASLVGKEVTIGQYDKNGKLEEIVGTVTATGTYGGQPVIFVDGKSYSLSSIMAVGRLPDPDPKPDPDPDPDPDPEPDPKPEPDPTTPVTT